MEEKKAYYAIIPANVRYDSELTPNAKLLYGEITALCNEKGYCWAGNDYFSELYEVNKSTISRWVNQLVKKGYLASEIIYKENSKEIQSRYLRLSTPIGNNEYTPTQNRVDPIGNIEHTPIGNIEIDNTTLLNTTSNNTLYKDTSSGTTTLSTKDTEFIIKQWNNLGLQQLRGINSSTNRYKALRARIKEYGFDDVIKAISNINDSKFLNGENDRNWTITFDWLVKPNNFIKVLEGNYTDKQGGTNAKDNRGTNKSQYGETRESEYDRLVRQSEERGATVDKDFECEF